jgi:hypothetical protein
MRTAPAEQKSADRKPAERAPLQVRRSGIIHARVHRVYRLVRSILEGPLTPARFTSDIDSLLDEATTMFCRYLYAEANWQRTEARRYWDELQGMVEYDLPITLLHRSKTLTRRRSRKKVNEVMSAVAKKMTREKKLVEALYTKWNCFRLRRPLRRPDESRFCQLFPWVKEVVRTTFEVEEINEQGS